MPGVKVLGEYLKNHVKKEHEALFPKVTKSDLDLDKVGELLQTRYDDLTPTATAMRGRLPVGELLKIRTDNADRSG